MRWMLGGGAESFRPADEVVRQGGAGQHNPHGLRTFGPSRR